MASSKPILISGAGLSGLLLARSLRNNNIPFLLYERDASIKARAQGYRIRISTDGLNALKEVLSEEQHARFLAGTASTEGAGGGINSVNAVTGEVKSGAGLGGQGPKGQGSGLGGNVLGVARGFLRQCLFEGLEETVHWGKQTQGYSLSQDGVTINFKDGSKSPEGSLLVAADGPQSTIARQLTEGKVRAYDTGARMIHGQSPARSFRGLGVGVWGVQDESRSNGTLALITNVRPHEPEDDVEFGWVFVGSPGMFEPPDDNFSIVGKVAAEISRHLTSEWSDKVRPIFEEQNDDEAAFLKMYTAAPEGVPEWQNSPRVTIMGDSSHCMTPAGGVSRVKSHITYTKQCIC